MRRAGLVVIAIALTFYAALCGALYFGQRSLLYFPTPESRSARAEALSLAMDGAVLKVWRVAGIGDRAMIYFGGNGEDVAGSIAPFTAAFPDTAIYLVNYRGYGGSTGSPSEAALLADAERVFDRVRAQHARVAVIGRSLGSGVAVHLASVRDVSKLALVTPYDSVLRIAQRRMSFVPVAWLLEDTYDSVAKAPRVRAPVLALLAEVDTSIPREHSERLVAAFKPGQVDVRVIPATDHNSISDAPEYDRALASFLLN
ncbi:MAG TPA: alpha/beta hydrolase [Gammaproteobacteria bacterium]|nr:alpha/beta hydrolase [Gammaproteobacteria bacterium]